MMHLNSENWIVKTPDSATLKFEVSWPPKWLN